MKIVDNILYIEFKDFVAAGWKEDAVKKANLRNGPFWVMIDNPDDRRKPLVQYDTLRPEHKAKLDAYFTPNVPQWYAASSILALLKPADEAHRWYMNYRYDGPQGPNTPLTAEHVAMCTKRAQYYNLLMEVDARGIKMIRQAVGIKDLPTFFKYFIALANQQGADVPTHYNRLQIVKRRYAAEGYAALLPARLGNSNRLKVKDAQAEDELLKWIEHPNQYDDVLVASMYNRWATQHGYEPITPAAVGVWRRKRAADIAIGRYGNTVLNERYIRQVKGQAPSAPLLLVESDDYNINYYFAGPDGAGDIHRRYVSYIVADSCTGLILGKSYREAASPTVEMVRLAWIDAMRYIRYLTGDWHLPFEVKVDAWQKDTVHPFIQAFAKLIPAGHGNKHRGYIEQLFGSPHFKRAEKLAAHNALNYNGNNLTARYRGVNLEVVHAHRKNRPVVGAEADQQVERLFAYAQQMPFISRQGGEEPSLEAQFKQRWAALPADKRRPISYEQYLLYFGFVHQPQGRSITISNRGVEVQIHGRRYSYDLPAGVDELQLIDKRVQVVYDPYDMSTVLITDFDRIRLLVSSAQLQARALEDAQPNSRHLLNQVLAHKRDTVARAAEGWQRRQASGLQTDPELALLGAVMPKETRNAIESKAERLLISKEYDSQDDDFFEPLIDM
jgi:transposase InsO family protein